MKERKKNRKFIEVLTKANTIMLFILLVIISLDFAKNIFYEDPKLLTVVFYAILVFSLFTYVQNIFFSYYDKNILPLLNELRRELEIANSMIKEEKEEQIVNHIMNTVDNP